MGKSKLITFLIVGTIGVGTIGLLVNELVFDWGRCATLTFAAINIVGLVTLAFASRGMKKTPKT